MKRHTLRGGFICIRRVSLFWQDDPLLGPVMDGINNRLERPPFLCELVLNTHRNVRIDLAFDDAFNL